MRYRLGRIKWLELGFTIGMAVVVWFFGAPPWAAVMFGTWVLYKELQV